MLTTKPRTLSITHDSVEGVKETIIAQPIGMGEALDAVPERLAEVEASVRDLLDHDEVFKALDIYRQAEYLELGFIFGTLDGTRDCHFPRQCYLDLLVAMRDGCLEAVKAEAVARAAELTKPVEPEPVEPEPKPVEPEPEPEPKPVEPEPEPIG